MVALLFASLEAMDSVASSAESRTSLGLFGRIRGRSGYRVDS